MRHYTKEELELYRHNESSFLQKISIKRHLKKCESCTALLTELQADDHFIDDLRASVQLFRNLSNQEPIVRISSEKS